MEIMKNGNALDTEGDDVKPLHWFPFVPKNWLSSAAVRAMRPEQRGAFIDLLAIAWGDGETEPALTTTDDEDLAEMSGLGERWATLGRKVRAQFIERDGRLYNVQLSQVWHERIAKRGSALPSALRERIPLALRRMVWERDGGRCRNGCDADRIEYDHIIPVIFGGRNTADNLQLLCVRCNRSKGARLPEIQ